MRRLYTLLFYLCFPFILIYLVIKNRKPHHYGSRWQELMGIYKRAYKTGGIWLHAASLGEAIVAKPLIEHLKKNYPHLPLTVTTIRPTGANYLAQQFGESIQHIYAPLDLPLFIKRFLTTIQPQLIVILETELWPNLLASCHQRNIPILIANARLSERSCSAYSRLPSLVKPMLNAITVIAAQSSDDAERFKNLGANDEKIKLAGNIKFDLTLPQDIQKRGEELRQHWKSDRPVWIAASTHAGEEEIIFSAHTQIKKQFPDCVLILVPRYPERSPELIKLANQYELKTVLRTEQANCDATMDVFLGNTIGELLLFYAAADIAFVGGSLIERGGHNLLEPAALNLPLITGAHIFNFKAIYHLLQQADAVATVNNAEELSETIIKFLQSSELRKQLGHQAKQIVTANQGAVLRHLDLIGNLL